MNLTSVLLFGMVFIFAFFMETNIIIVEQNDIEAAVKKKRIYNILFFIILFLIAALRHPNTGADTSAYYSMFHYILNSENPLNNYWETLITSLRNGSFTDAIFWNFFSKLASFIIQTPQLWLAFVSGLFLFAVYTTIKKYSDDPVISWTYILSLFIYSFILQGLRQSMAMTIVLFSLKYVFDRKLWKFLLLMGLATLFHQSAIIFVIVYPMHKLKVRIWYFIVIGGMMILSYAFPSVLLSILPSAISSSRFGIYLYGREGMYTISGWLLLFIIFSFCYRYKGNAVKNNPHTSMLFTLLMIGLAMQSMAGMIAEMFRVSYYFNMFSMLLVPNVICSIQKPQYRTEVRFLVLLAFMAYFFYSGGFVYRFFWQ